MLLRPSEENDEVSQREHLTAITCIKHRHTEVRKKKRVQAK